MKPKGKAENWTDAEIEEMAEPDAEDISRAQVLADSTQGIAGDLFDADVWEEDDA